MQDKETMLVLHRDMDDNFYAGSCQAKCINNWEGRGSASVALEKFTTVRS